MTKLKNPFLVYGCFLCIVSLGSGDFFFITQKRMFSVDIYVREMKEIEIY